MSNSSCYVCKHSDVERSTGYLVCKRHLFKKYVQPCGVCELFSRGFVKKSRTCIDQEEEIEIEITVIDSDKRKG